VKPCTLFRNTFVSLVLLPTKKALVTFCVLLFEMHAVCCGCFVISCEIADLCRVKPVMTVCCLVLLHPVVNLYRFSGCQFVQVYTIAAEWSHLFMMVVFFARCDIVHVASGFS